VPVQKARPAKAHALVAQPLDISLPTLTVQTEEASQKVAEATRSLGTEVLGATTRVEQAAGLVSGTVAPSPRKPAAPAPSPKGAPAFRFTSILEGLDLRQAVLAHEILGPPISRRRRGIMSSPFSAPSRR
jgi:hypothetical protein